MMVTEGCSAADVFGPSMIPAVITNLTHKMNRQQLLQSSSSRHVEAHLLTDIYRHSISLRHRHLGEHFDELVC